MEPVPPTPIAADDAAVLQALLEHGRSIVFTIDDTWRILSINRIPDGLGSAEVIGTSCLDYVPPQYQAVARKAFEQVLRTGRPSRYEIRARGPHDSIACYVTQVLPLRPDGGAARLLLVSDDDEMRILGMRALGVHASTTIEGVSLMMQSNRSVRELAELLHPHPAVTEGLQDCVRMLMGTSIHKPEVFRNDLRLSRVNYSPDGAPSSG